ncbi:MAG TPA: hypothetical protein VFL56_04510 [Solirubrobacterales bacterium]|nr:hypothetical protein [Solirubrobacterales bacterium]
MRKTQLQALLAVGGIGAALALIQLLGVAGGLVGVGLMIFSAVLTAPSAPRPEAEGINWWALLAGGALLALVGVPLELLLEAPGGLLTAAGGAMAMVGVVFGMPTS